MCMCVCVCVCKCASRVFCEGPSLHYWKVRLVGLPAYEAKLDYLVLVGLLPWRLRMKGGGVVNGPGNGPATFHFDCSGWALTKRRRCTCLEVLPLLGTKDSNNGRGPAKSSKSWTKPSSLRLAT